MKQELYYVNGNKSKPYTWNQLLYWCYECIAGLNWDYDRKMNGHRYIPRYNAYDHQRINTFFSEFRHNENDGIWSGGYWKKEVIGYQVIEIVGPLREREGRYINNAIYENKWVPRAFTPKRFQVTDSYGRIIPSGYIRDAYLKYIPNEEDHKIIRNSRYKYRYNTYRPSYDHERDFRKGPVPGRGGCRVHCGRRYAGNHGNNVREIKHRPGYEQIQKETCEEYGVTFKLNRRTLVDLDACCYHFNHRKGNKGFGWKRTRKKKQWM